MLAAGETVPLDTTVWLGPNQPVTFREIAADGPILLLFYLFDWTAT